MNGICRCQASEQEASKPDQTEDMEEPGLKQHGVQKIENLVGKPGIVSKLAITSSKIDYFARVGFPIAFLAFVILYALVYYILSFVWND